jgi:hypothetical protein
MALGDLQRQAKARGLSDLGLFSRDPWETLDREEVLVPVAYALHGLTHHDQPGYLAAGDLLIREETGYRSWEELADEASERHETELHVLYHHWQLLWLGELQDALTPAVPWGNLGDGLERFYGCARSSRQPPRSLFARRFAVPPPITSPSSCC